MKTDLTLPCLIFMIITIYLYYHSKTNDKYLLSIMIFGQFILLFGSIIKNDNFNRNCTYSFLDFYYNWYIFF